MSEVYNIPRDQTLARIATALEGNLVEQLDGTPETYKKIMREWFITRGADGATPALLTELCDEWYRITRPEWVGWTEFYQPDVSSVSTGTKGGDNAGMTCEPSTDTVAGQDDYAGNPLFACVDVNWEVDSSTLQPVITAIDGITSNFRRKDLNTYVGVMQMSGYMFFQENDETYIRGYSASRDIPYSDIYPLPSAINPDGSVRQWVVHAKYVSHSNGTKMASCSGYIPTTFLSHNTVHTLSNGNGAQYSGYTTADDAFMHIMYMIKYASLTMDGIIQGCCAMNYQYYAQVAESGVKRMILSTSNAANLEVGMSVLIGTYSGGVSRDTAAVYSVTGQAGALIIDIEDIEIDGTTYSAVYVDTDSTFDVVVNGSATDGSTVISTFHWRTGMTDGVLGNDGSYKDNTAGKYPGKIQGIEFMNGCYELIADAIIQGTVGDDGVCWYEPWIVKKTADQATSISAAYEALGLQCQNTNTGTSSAWQYIKKKGFKDGVFFPIELGGSSTTYHRDGYYQPVPATQTRELALRGSLGIGVAYAGLSALYGNNAVSATSWNFASRLSAAGNRGEWTA